MKLSYEVPDRYYPEHTLIYYLTKTVSKKRVPFYVGKTVAPAPRLIKHREKHGDTVEMFIHKVVPDKDWKVEEIKAIDKFKKAGYKLVNKHRGGAGGERGLKFNLQRYIDRWSNDHNVVMPDNIVDKAKFIFKRLRKDNISKPYKYIDGFLLMVTSFDRYKTFEELSKQAEELHLKEMKELYPNYYVNIG